MQDKILLAAEDALDDFARAVLPAERVPRGIAVSEGFALVVMARLFRVAAIIESGTANGGSTAMMAKALPSIALTTMDWEENDEAKRQLESLDVEIIRGDSRKLLPSAIASVAAGSVGVFIDGPKGDDAILLAIQSIESPSVAWVGVHDIATDEHPNTRAAFEAIPCGGWVTDESWWLNEYGGLDNHATDRHTIGFRCKDLGHV